MRGAHRLLRALEGRTIDYYSFARDTPKGKPMECHILSAHAREVLLPAQSGSPGAHTSVNGALQSMHDEPAASGSAIALLVVTLVLLTPTAHARGALRRTGHRSSPQQGCIIPQAAPQRRSSSQRPIFTIFISYILLCIMYLHFIILYRTI